jgi:hypothetical protein
LPIRYHFWFAGENSELADPIENVEIAKDRTKHRIDERKSLAVKVRAGAKAHFKPCLKPFEFISQGCGLLHKGRFIGRAIKSGNVVKHSGSKLDPGAMFGAAQRVGRMQRKRLRLLQIFEYHRTLEDGRSIDFEHRRLAER